ncbi:histidine kinase, partial [Reticulomyxa filosa]
RQYVSNNCTANNNNNNNNNNTNGNNNSTTTTTTTTTTTMSSTTLTSTSTTYTNGKDNVTVHCGKDAATCSLKENYSILRVYSDFSSCESFPATDVNSRTFKDYIVVTDQCLAINTSSSSSSSSSSS